MIGKLFDRTPLGENDLNRLISLALTFRFKNAFPSADLRRRLLEQAIPFVRRNQRVPFIRDSPWERQLLLTRQSVVGYGNFAMQFGSLLR